MDRKLIIFVCSLLLSSCSEDVIEVDCNCNEITRTKFVRTFYFNGGSGTETYYTTESKSVDLDCSFNGKVLFEDNNKKIHIECN